MKKRLTKYVYSFILPVLLSIPVSAVANFFHKYIFSDWDFLIFLVILVIIDTGLSWVYHIKHKSLSSKGFSMIFTKVMSYAVMLIVANAARGIETNVQIDDGGEWVASFICWALFMREGLSIMEKLKMLNINIVPNKIMRYFKNFNEQGVYNENKNNKENEDNNDNE